MKPITDINKTWQPRSKIGWDIEQEFLETYVLPYHKNARRVDLKEYDIICNDAFCIPTHQQKKPLKWEIKSDQYSDYSGNFCIEFEFKGKPSGLAATQADFYVLTSKKHFFVFVSEELRKYIGKLKQSQLYFMDLYKRGIMKTEPYKTFKIVQSGDGEAATGKKWAKAVLLNRRRTVNSCPYLQILPRAKPQEQIKI